MTIINIYAPNIGALQYISKTLMTMKWEINDNKIIVGDLTQHLLQWTNHSDRKVNKKTQDLNNKLDQIDLTDI